MKRFLLFAAVLAALAACEKGTGDDGTRKIKNLGTEIISTDAKFLQIKYDSAYVLTFESQLKELSAKEGFAMPDVDFSKNTVIVATGIAPNNISHIETKLYTNGADQYMDIDVEVEKGEAMKPQKWNLMLKAPAETDPQINCTVKYDIEFAPERQLPINQVYFGSAYNQSNLYKADIDPYKDTYLIEIEASDSTLFFSSLKAAGGNIIHKKVYDETQGWNRYNGEVIDGNGNKNPYFVYGGLTESGKLLQHMIVENCDYRTLAGMKDKIIFCSKVFDYVETTKVSVTYYSGLAAIHPKLYLTYNEKKAESSNLHEKLEYMAEAVGAKYEDSAIILHRGSKVDYLQMQELLIDSGIEVTFSSTLCCNMLQFLPLPQKSN